MDTLFNIQDRAQKAFNEVIENRAKILEDFTKAYIAETGLMPSQIRCVWQNSLDNMTTRVWFEKLPDDKGSGI
jgi:hypothetical protein